MSVGGFARSFGLALVVSGSIIALGCDDQQVEIDTPGPSAPYYGGGEDAGAAPDGSTVGGQPMLVVVDSNRTMTANPGQGVGVFTQYTTGGHWNVWWTCDTSLTSEACAYDVTASVMSGSIANAAGQALGRGDTIVDSDPQKIEVTTSTTTTVQGVTFDTVDPSGDAPIITLTVMLGGSLVPGSLYFVQDGQINGAYTGNLTDPLMFEPSAP